MAITYALPGYRLVDQLSSPTVDKLADENARDNCVPSSLCAMLGYYTGKVYQPDAVKDAVYGQGWTGFEAARSYVTYCAAQGMVLTPFDVTKTSVGQASLVSKIHSEVVAKRPVLITIPSEWNSAPTNPIYQPWLPWTYRGPSHVCSVYGVGPGMVRLHNPWHGVLMDVSDAWLKARLLYSEIWLSAKGEATMANIIPTGWKDNGSTLSAPSGVAVVKGFRDFVLSFPGGWQADNTPRGPEYIDAGGHSRQDFRFCSLGWLNSTAKFLPIGDELADVKAQLGPLQAQLMVAKANQADPLEHALAVAVRNLVAA